MKILCFLLFMPIPFWMCAQKPSSPSPHPPPFAPDVALKIHHSLWNRTKVKPKKKSISFWRLQQLEAGRERRERKKGKKWKDDESLENNKEKKKVLNKILTQKAPLRVLVLWLAGVSLLSRVVSQPRWRRRMSSSHRLKWSLSIMLWAIVNRMATTFMGVQQRSSA